MNMPGMTLSPARPNLGFPVSTSDGGSSSTSPHIIKRTSNTEEDEIHKRAVLLLTMANSVETSNVRRRRKLQQIESGTTDQVQQEIEDIMEEKPLDMMTLLRETEPEALPTTEELKERYAGQFDNTTTDEEESDDESNGDDDGDGEKNQDETKDSDDKETSLFGHDSVDLLSEGKAKFEKTQDKIVAITKQAPVEISRNIPSSTLQAHTEPLQEQLKRSFAAIVKLRENSDLRYRALEKKYLDLKRNVSSISIKDGDSVNTLSPIGVGTREDRGHRTASEELNHAFEAIIRMRENSDLRYGVLESKYLDLKRSHAEADARNERLEIELEMYRKELARRGGNIHNIAMSNSQSSLRESKNMVQSHEVHAGDQYPPEKVQKLMEDFKLLCDKVVGCDDCINHVPAAALLQVNHQLTKMQRSGSLVDTSKNIHHYAEGDNFDTDSDSEENSGASSDSDTFANTAAVLAKRHDGVMALLGASWEKLSKVDEHEATSGRGRFANLSESKAEQKLKGKKSQFVAAQSGVYCRIDHNMQDQYGNLDNFSSPSRPPRPPLPSVKSTTSPRRQQPKMSLSPQAAPQQMIDTMAAPAPTPAMPPRSPSKAPSPEQPFPQQSFMKAEPVPEATISPSAIPPPVKSIRVKRKPEQLTPKIAVVPPPNIPVAPPTAAFEEDNQRPPADSPISVITPNQVFPTAQADEHTESKLISQSSVTSFESSASRNRKIPPAKLDAREREAKRKEALKEAAAKSHTKKGGFMKNPFKRKQAGPVAENAENLKPSLEAARTTTSRTSEPPLVPLKASKSAAVQSAKAKSGKQGPKEAVEC